MDEERFEQLYNKILVEKIGIIQLLMNSFACQSQVPVKKVGKK